MENPNLLQNLEADVISLIFTYIIFDACDFSSFAKLLLVWERRQPRTHAKFVLERLNWDVLYAFHQHPAEVTRDQFNGFISYCVRNNVHQAMFYDSTQNLFRHIHVQDHLAVLSTLSGTHFPSYFSFIFFKAICRPFDIDETAQQMIQMVRNSYLRRILDEFMNLLCDMYFNIAEDDYLLPLLKFCPQARNKEPFYQIDGLPLHDDIWNSLCSKTVEEKTKNVDDAWFQILIMEHIWKADCEHCTLQLIVYKILLNTPMC